MAILEKKKKKVRIYSGSYVEQNRNKRDFRIGVLMVFFVVFSLIIVFRLFKLQIIDHKYYIALASGQHEIFKHLYPSRGSILVKDKQGEVVRDDQSFYPVATNKTMYLLYAIPKDIQDPEAALQVLKETFNIEIETFQETSLDSESNDSTIEDEDNPEDDSGKLNTTADSVALDKAELEELNKQLVENWKMKLNKKDDPYEPLKHLVSEQEINALEAYGLEGFHWTAEMTRFYPEKNISSSLLGFVGKQAEDNMLKGYYGIEGCYNSQLAGESGFLRSELDTFGRWIAVAGKDFRKADNGSDLILTIDKSVQYYVCDQLNKAVEQYDAIGGSVVVMDPQTGEVMAMCNNPDFDPNEYNKVEDINVFNNPILSESYEPGSVFKPITMAAALNSGQVDPFTGYQDNGELHISGHVIKNSDLKANGWQTMTQVLEKSLNTGAVFAARKVGLEQFKYYVQEFGFGKQTDIDLCQEHSGNLKSLDSKNDIYLATASFGQGITVTPMQLVHAFAAIANDGKLVKPYIVEQIVNQQGEVVQKTTPQVVSQVISPQTAKLLGGMLVSVVKNGHATKAGVPGYLVAGKTGTAQVPDFEKGGYSDKTIHTFVGFAPYNNPRFAMVVKLEQPTAVQFSSDSAAPLFGKIAKFILNYYEVPPEVK
ncbi:penicillin-binding protein 2 [Candidatus Falkowbacteria bacterium]|jgi:cell division protein FtsI/penicillin-binding protein 2|nr:penicillin-binding protein 2 [Candidatus Falkowbacteria bacterium]MBT6573714.1 penicillin-binding protein 2 [Candidatus Falkowbacteria bacterium]MBT7349090.1 penicillin-binding protein 2 [Candidatus Falkowbacteria bacterium]MBT7500041.1 penicillin-binding protein 2 [Candidatus Falkowbacteria bacterium]